MNLIPFFIFIGFLACLCFIAWYVGKSNHKWKYRNPHDRTCERCGRRECETMDIGVATDGSGRIGMVHKWETYYPLAHSPEKCGGIKDE